MIRSQVLEPWGRVGGLVLLTCLATQCVESRAQVQGSVAQIPVPQSDRQATMIEQISVGSKAPSARVEPLPAPVAKANEAGAATQLPAGLDPLSNDPEQETSLTPPEPAVPDMMGQVIRAWHVIHNRGQQPTPELIAREIGPDALTAFLNQYPNGVAIITSPEPPKAPPPATLPPDTGP